MFRWFVDKNSTRRRRRKAVAGSYLVLALVYSLIIAAYVLNANIGLVGGTLLFGLLLVSLSLIKAIRASIQNLADANVQLLDERQKQVRNDAYRLAYKILSSILLLSLILLCTIFMVDSVLGLPTLSLPTLKTGNVGYIYTFIYIPCFLIVTTLPTMIVAWNEPDSIEEGE